MNIHRDTLIYRSICDIQGKNQRIHGYKTELRVFGDEIYYIHLIYVMICRKTRQYTDYIHEYTLSTRADFSDGEMGLKPNILQQVQ